MPDNKFTNFKINKKFDGLPTGLQESVSETYLYSIRMSSFNHSSHQLGLSPSCLKYQPSEPLHDKTNKITVRPAKTPISLGIRPVWSESSLCTQWVAKDPSFLHADSEDSDQTERITRLIWVFAGRTCLFVGFVMKRFIYKQKVILTIEPRQNVSLGVSDQARHKSDCAATESS